MIKQMRARRNELAAQLAAGRAQYNHLEQTLKELDRQLCMIAGGLQELDALLAGGRGDERGADQDGAPERENDDQDDQQHNPAIMGHAGMPQ